MAFSHYIIALICTFFTSAVCAGSASRLMVSVDDQPRYQLLFAEVAYQRGHGDVALQQYHDIAIKTKNVKVASEATRMALEQNNPAMAIRPAVIWANQDTNNARPQALVTMMVLPTQYYSQTLPFLMRITQQSQSAPYLKLLIDQTEPKEQHKLIELFHQVHAQNGFSAETGLVAATMLQNNQQYTLAHKIVKNVLNEKPNWSAAQTLHDQLQAQLD